MQEISEILRKHQLWLGGKSSGERANLCGADLSGADLSGANLRGADLCGANLPIKIVRIECGGWTICIYPEKTSIGCQTHPNDKWLEWTHESEEIKKMDSKAADWWKERSEFIKAAIRFAMADLPNTNQPV